MPRKSQDNQIKKPSWPVRYMRRIVLISILVVVVAGLGLGGWSIYNFKIKPYRQVAIRVGEVSFDMNYYINTIKNYYGTLPPDALSEYSSAGDTEIEMLAGYVERLIEQDEIVKQGSQAFGIQITKDEIIQKLKNLGKPVTQERIDALMAQELIKKQVPDNQPQIQAQAILLENETVAQAARARLEAGESFEQLAPELSRITSDKVEKINNGDLGWETERQIDLTLGSSQLGALVFDSETGTLSTPIYDDSVSKQYGYWIMKIIEKTEETETTSAKIHLQGILLGSEAEANAIKDKLNNGEDINELAKQYSQQPNAKDSGAELGWLTQPLIDVNPDSPFNLPVDAIYGPVTETQTPTKGGFWIFKVQDKNDKLALTDAQKQVLQQDLFDRCNNELRKDPNYNSDNFLTTEQRDMALNDVVNSLGPGSVVIHTGSLPDGEAGKNYTYQLEIYGNKKGNTWSITTGALPQGISLDPSTGLISGLPQYAGLSSFTIEVNSGIHYWRQNLTLRLRFPVSVTTTSIPDGQTGVEYSAILEVLGESDTYSWSILSGTLPDGLELDQTSGEIYGTPTTAGTYNFSVQVTDGITKADRDLSISIK